MGEKRIKKGLKKGFAFGYFLLFGIFLYASAFAQTFTLTVAPYEGGYDLRYGKVNYISERANKEVNINITSDIAKQYRLVQTLLEPLSTAEGVRIPQNNFVVYGIRGTNRFGTLNVEQEMPVSLARQVLYTSNDAGVADSFTLVYGLIISSKVAPGSYRGRIAFALEPIESTQSSVTVILNIFAEIEVESSVEISTEAGSKNIFLKFDPKEPRPANILVAIKGGFGRQFKISQLLSEQPVSNEGKLLDWSAVNLVGSGAQKGAVVNTVMPFSARQDVIYNSSSFGEADTFQIAYNLVDLPQVVAGRYKTSIKYFLEGAFVAQQNLIDTLYLEIEYPPVFNLIVTPEFGGAIQFRDLRAQQPPRTNEVVLKINSNLGRRYQVSQKIPSLFTNREGKAIPTRYFTLKEESLNTKGILKYPHKTEVSLGEMVLFISDDTGSSDSFKVIYELTTPVDLQAGDYLTNITYSIAEI